MSSGIRFPNALATLGGGPDLLESDHLASLDEFHIGDEGPRWSCSINSTYLQGGAWSADVVRGTARHLARRHGVEVTGVDLTAEYVQVATSLTGLAGRAQFQQGNGTAKIPGAIGAGRATDASRTMPKGLRNRLLHEIRDRAAQNSRSALDLQLVMAPDLSIEDREHGSEFGTRRGRTDRGDQPALSGCCPSAARCGRRSHGRSHEGVRQA